MSSLKEADYLRFGSSKKVMNLSKADQLLLFDSIKKDSFEEYWKVNSKLISPEPSAPIRNIPFRVYFENRVLQDLIPPVDREGSLSLIKKEITQL